MLLFFVEFQRIVETDVQIKPLRVPRHSRVITLFNYEIVQFHHVVDH